MSIFLATASPSQTKIGSATMDIKESETIEANCTATVNPANNVNYIWYFGDSKIGTSSKLRIEQAGKEKNGAYRCVANNSIGSDEVSFSVNIKCK